MPIQRLSFTTRAVLTLFLDNPTTELHGYEVTRRTDVQAGTVYPILRRLARDGWLAVREEERGERTDARPLRLYYRITPRGVAEAKRLVGNRRRLV